VIGSEGRRRIARFRRSIVCSSPWDRVRGCAGWSAVNDPTHIEKEGCRRYLDHRPHSYLIASEKSRRKQSQGGRQVLVGLLVVRALPGLRAQSLITSKKPAPSRWHANAYTRTCVHACTLHTAHTHILTVLGRLSPPSLMEPLRKTRLKMQFREFMALMP
jgi:hypothetical protein